MSDDRARILGEIRRALGRDVPDQATQAEIAESLSQPNRLIPQRAVGTAAELVARFVTMAQAANATVVRLDDVVAVPTAVADFMACHEIEAEVLVAPDPRLTELDWRARGLLVRSGSPERHQAVAVTGAFAAAAETGTLVVCSGPQHPSSLNLLPDNHIVVLAESRIVGSYEETWDLLRAAYPDGLPRTVLWITGPSRTGDIEQTLYLGAHGPLRVHILLVDHK
jgi:L-lactate dehydrogenase complex protein LldG